MRLHVLFVPEKIGDRHFPPQRKIDAVKIARFQPGQGQRRFAQRLARDSAGIDASATDLMMTIDQRDGLFRRGGRGGGDKPRRAAADDNQVVLFQFDPHGAVFRVRSGQKRVKEFIRSFKLSKEVHELGNRTQTFRKTRSRGKQHLPGHHEFRLAHHPGRKLFDHGPRLGTRYQFFRYRGRLLGWGGEQGDTEEILGRWFAQGGGRRDAVVLATKVFNPVKRKANLPEPNTDARSLSAYKIRKHCEGSLKRLQTDHIDLYQMHHVDRDCPWDETWQAFEQLGNQGKVVYVGSSNFAGWDIATACQEASKRGLAGLSSEQSIYHLNNRIVELEVIRPAATTVWG